MGQDGMGQDRVAQPGCRGSAPAGRARWCAWLPGSAAALQNRFLCLQQGCVGVFTNFPPLPSFRMLGTALAAFSPFPLGRGAGVVPCQRILIKPAVPAVQREERLNRSRSVETLLEPSPAASS